MPNPIMPQILQFADWVSEPWLPGDWYNSRTQSYNNPIQAYRLDRLGEGVDRFGQGLRDGAGRAGGWLGRLGSGIGDLAEGGASFLNSLSRRGEPSWSDPSAGRWGPQELRRAEERRQRSIREQMEAANPENVWMNPGSGGRNETSRRLGAGQIGRAGNEAMAYYQNAIRNRGGALMER